MRAYLFFSFIFFSPLHASNLEEMMKAKSQSDQTQIPSPYKEETDRFCNMFKGRCTGSSCGVCLSRCQDNLKKFFKSGVDGKIKDSDPGKILRPRRFNLWFQGSLQEICSNEKYFANKKLPTNCPIKVRSQIFQATQSLFKIYGKEGDTCSQL